MFNLLRLLCLDEESAVLERYGNGRAISISPGGATGEGFCVTIQDRISERHVVDGKLAPVCVEYVRRDGGKICVDLHLTLHGMEGLHRALGHAIARERQRRFFEGALESLFAILARHSNYLKGPG